tara:strand:- start:49 stop:780 length:732 start_codon:yes stop_codon:yes gene_type:complete
VVASVTASHKGGASGSYVLRPSVVNVVYFKSCYGMVLSAEKNGDMTADRFKVGAWEVFGFHPRGSNKWNISTAHQTNITVSGKSLVAKKTSSNDKIAQFYIHYRTNTVAGGGSHKYMAISSASTGKYWRADEDGELKCDHASGTSTECLFYVEDGGVGSKTSLTTTTTTAAATAAAASTTKKGRLVLDDSSGDESSDDEFAQQLATSRRAVDEDEDDEEEDSVVVPVSTKRKRMLLSDDDEDD